MMSGVTRRHRPHHNKGAVDAGQHLVSPFPWQVDSCKSGIPFIQDVLREVRSSVDRQRLKGASMWASGMRGLPGIRFAGTHGKKKVAMAMDGRIGTMDGSGCDGWSAVVI